MEQKVAQTLLEQPQRIVIAGEPYAMPAPSLATLVLFSGFVGQLPHQALSNESPVAALLAQGQKLENIAKAMACVVLGAKEFNKPVPTTFKKRLVFFFKGQKTALTKGELLTQKIYNASIEEISEVFLKLLTFMRLHDFFMLTTSLVEMNIVKPTKAQNT